MKHKLITPGVHGLIDYAFGLSLITVPKLLGADKRTIQIYHALAAQIFLYSAVTRQPYAIAPLISMQTHKKIDLINLGTLALLATSKRVRTNKNTLAFTLGMVAMGLTTVLLTDWKKQNKR